MGERGENAYQIRNHYFCPSEVQNKGQQVSWRKVDRILLPSLSVDVTETNGEKEAVLLKLSL